MQPALKFRVTLLHKVKRFSEFVQKWCYGLGHYHTLMFAHVGSIWFYSAFRRSAHPLYCAPPPLVWYGLTVPSMCLSLTPDYSRLLLIRDNWVKYRLFCWDMWPRPASCHTTAPLRAWSEYATQRIILCLKSWIILNNLSAVVPNSVATMRSSCGKFASAFNTVKILNFIR